MSDHARGCEGRNYTCTCGYDAASTALVERLEAERSEQWNLRRDAEGSRDAARAAADSLRVERDALRTVLSDILSGWDFWDVNPHDREPPRDAISRARSALSASQSTSSGGSGGAGGVDDRDQPNSSQTRP